VNIIKNGLEAILEAKQEAGSINIRVSRAKIPQSRHSRWVRVDIIDNGRGIPEDEIAKLATGFTTRSEKKPNSGIGLLIGKRILHIHGGRLSFESTLGVGTTVTLLLPEFSATQETRAASQSESGDPDEDSPERSDSPDDIIEETTYPQGN
jgi:signal transduction histidine kinase